MLTRTIPAVGGPLRQATLALAFGMAVTGLRCENPKGTTIESTELGQAQDTEALRAARLPRPGEATPRRIAQPQGHFAREGFVRMAPPLQLPGRASRRDWTDVWLRLPEHGQLDVLPDARGRLRLTYPNGTIADRVEFVSFGEPPNPTWSIADVRGTELVQGRELFHALRPTANTAHAPLEGFAWFRDDATASSAATEQLATRVAKLAQVAPQTEVVRRARANNQCASCHLHDRDDNASWRQFGLVNRGTDHAGFFVVRTVLAGQAPLETYLPHERNLNDPLIRFVCPNDGETSLASRGDDGLPHCASGRIPVGVLDVAKGLALHDRRTRDLCAARRYLGRHMTTRAREHYARALAECGPQ